MTTSVQRIPAWIAAMYEKVDAGDASAYIDGFADDAELCFGNSPAVRGKQPILVALQTGHDAHAMAHTFTNIWEVGNTAILESSVVYTYPDGGTSKFPAVTILERDAGLIRSMRIYLDVPEPTHRS
jgi:ketosteroid isomerase-like protein